MKTGGGPIYYDDVRRAEARQQFKKACKDLFGFGAEHLTLDYSNWNRSLWHKEDMKILQEKPKKTLEVLDKVWMEIANTDRNTTIKPIFSELKLGIPSVHKSLIYNEKNPNIIPTSGLVEIGARGTGETSTTTGTTHGAVGSGTTTEALADKTLETELDRKEFDTDGTRAMSGTTERYGLAFSRSDFTSDVTITEGGLLTKLSGGELVAHILGTGITVTTGRIFTMQVDITHINGTEV